MNDCEKRFIRLKCTWWKIKNNNIRYLGFLNNPYSVISKARALIAPLFQGGGVKVNCLESLLCGIPIIGTNVAFEGIDDKLIFQFIIAHTPSEYLSSIETFDDHKYDRIAWKKQVCDLYPKRLFINHLKRILD
ncbi:MAG: glycosyltransferase family 4 protein [Pseudomonadota bacterium]